MYIHVRIACIKTRGHTYVYTYQRCSARSGICVRRVADFAARKSKEERHWRTGRTQQGLEKQTEGVNDEREMVRHGRGEKPG